jgi:hypothetical protein
MFAQMQYSSDHCLFYNNFPPGFLFFLNPPGIKNPSDFPQALPDLSFSPLLVSHQQLLFKLVF